MSKLSKDKIFVRRTFAELLAESNEKLRLLVEAVEWLANNCSEQITPYSLCRIKPEEIEAYFFHTSDISLTGKEFSFGFHKSRCDRIKNYFFVKVIGEASSDPRYTESVVCLETDFMFFQKICSIFFNLNNRVFTQDVAVLRNLLEHSFVTDVIKKARLTR